MRTVVIVESFPPHESTFLQDHIDGLDADVFAINASEQDVASSVWSCRPYVTSLRKERRVPRGLGQRIRTRVAEELFGLPRPGWPEGMEMLWDEYVRERNPDVALAEFGPNAICALSACRRHAVPLVAHFHGYDASACLRSSRYRHALRELFDLASSIVVVSTKMRSTLVGLGCPRSKLNLIRCGASPNLFVPASGVDKQPCHFISVASFLPVKGPFETLRAFTRVAEQLADISLTMCGKGRLLASVRREVGRSRHASRVHLVGHVPHENAREFMRGSAVFVQHSRTAPRTGAVEGSPVAIAEAMLCGLPVVGTRHGGIPDLVVHGETGYLVEEGDWQDMARYMSELARDPKQRLAMGEAGRQRAFQLANHDIQIERLRTCLTRACAT